MTGHMDDNLKKIIYKPPHGKLLRLEVRVEDGVINFIRIRGDFFVYPEEAISELENFLQGKDIKKISQLLAEFLNNSGIAIIGFTPQDLVVALGAGKEILA
jgi:lipoate---protein ligase